MSIYLKNFGCPDKFTKDWKLLHATKWILLCAGLAMAVSGYYIGSSLVIFDGGHQMWILCALFWGCAGVCMVAYSIALIHHKMKIYNVRRSLKYEENLNAVPGCNFHNEDNGICAQRDKQISELLSTHCYKLKSFSWGLNEDVTFKGKYIGCNGTAKRMYGSYETVYNAETLNTSNGSERKVSNELSEYLCYKKQSDIFYQRTKSFDAFASESFGSHKISSSLEESSFAKFTTWEDQTSQFQNDFGFKDISNNEEFVFKYQPEIGINENIVHKFDKDIEINNSFQLFSSFTCELFEDPYFCKTPCENETLELALESSVSGELSKIFETEIFSFKFASFATLLIIDYLSLDVQHSYDKILKGKDPETVTHDVNLLDKQFWSKIPMKRSNSKLTKKRNESIIFKNHEAVSKNEPDIHHWDKSYSLISASSGNESTLLLTDRNTCRPSEISLSALTFMEELPRIIIEDVFISEKLAESEIKFHSLYAV